MDLQANITLSLTRDTTFLRDTFTGGSGALRQVLATQFRSFGYEVPPPSPPNNTHTNTHTCSHPRSGHMLLGIARAVEFRVGCVLVLLVMCVLYCQGDVAPVSFWGTA